jgi:hypothetical protein
LLQLLALPEVLPLPAAEEVPPVLPVNPLGRVPATRSAHQVCELLPWLEVLSRLTAAGALAALPVIPLMELPARESKNELAVAASHSISW